MNQKEKSDNLKLIKKAIKEFPKVIKQKEDAHREKEKIIKAFMPMAKKLQKQTEKK